MSLREGREGSCRCAAFRYRLLRAPLALYACHCRACQKQSSSAFGMSMWVERAQPWMKAFVASSCGFEREPEDEETLAEQWQNASSPRDAR